MNDPGTQKSASVGKVLLLGCGALMLLALLCGGGFALFLAQGKAEIDPVVDAFVQKLEAEDYAGAYASVGPELQQQASEQEFTDMLRAIRGALGPLQSKSTRNFNLNSQPGGSTATVIYNATFAQGSGSIRATFSDSSGAWQVIGWRVDSPKLAELLTCAKCNNVSQSLAKFCPNCGEPLWADASAPSEEAPAPAPGPDGGD